MVTLNITDQELIAIIGRLYVEGLLLRQKVAELQAQVDSLAPKPEPNPEDRADARRPRVFGSDTEAVGNLD